jgi:hypothetical protein
MRASPPRAHGNHHSSLGGVALSLAASLLAVRPDSGGVEFGHKSRPISSASFCASKTGANFTPQVVFTQSN